MNNPTSAFSIEDIYNFLSNPSIDLNTQVLNIEFLKQNFNSFDEIFKNNYSIILFIPNPKQNEGENLNLEDQIGHFTLFTNFDDENVEFFDSFAKEPPSIIKEICQRFNKNLILNKTKLQSDKSYICAKYCLARMQSLPTSLKVFTKILRSSKYSPDYIINNLYVNKRQKNE